MTPVQISRATTYQDYVAVERSEVCPFSAGNKHLLLQHAGGSIGLYTGDGQFVRLLSPPLLHDSEPRWSHANPDVLFYVRGNRLMRYLVPSGIGVAEEFAEYESISGLGESDLSANGDHFVFCGTRKNGSRQVFIYSLKEGAKTSFDVDVASLDGLKISSDNKAVASYPEGIYVGGAQRTTANGHNAVAVYRGKPILLYCNSNEPDPLKGFENAIVNIDIETGKQTGLAPFPWSLAMHISTCDQPWCLVPVYAPDGSLPNALWKVPYDRSDVTLLYEWQSPYDERFQPRASLSRDGSRCVFNVWDGTTCNVMLGMLTAGSVVDPPILPPPPPPKITGWIDYSPWVGKKYWIMRPRKDGALDIIEMDEKHGNN